MFSKRSGNGVKGQHAGCVSIRAALDEMTRITLSDGKGQRVPFLPTGEGGSGQRPAVNERSNEKQGRSCPCSI
ncbi:MAG: hypothetical protein U0L10_05025 [Lachnospiraceae bacterium]|nr:hypothetical protein [Lachnospiraceae bacterium]